MDGRGGCCIARYAGNMYDMSKINRIMLRYRPIAPKPDTNGSRTAAADDSVTHGKTGRGRRRYVRKSSSKKADGVSNGGVAKKCKCKSKSGEIKMKSFSSEENESNGMSTISTGSVSGGDCIVTLPLLPETPETNPLPSTSQEYTTGGTFSTSHGVEKGPLWLNFGSGGSQVQDKREETVGRQQQPVRVVGTWVRVECITETSWVVGVDVNGGLGGCTDVEKLMNLERDTCPGFISDGDDTVVWVNKAYREMVVGQEAAAEEEVMVCLVMKEGLQLPQKKCPAFTCRVRVVTCLKGKSSVTIPCDVWRLDSGPGFAWRLDTKAALSLGR